MPKRLMVTLQTVGISDRETNFHMVGTSPDGDAIVRKKTLLVPPFTLIELTSDEIAELLPLEAIREPTSSELAIGRVAEPELER